MLTYKHYKSFTNDNDEPFSILANFITAKFNEENVFNSWQIKNISRGQNI